MITVIGVDPGKNIGFARIDVEEKAIVYEFRKVVNWDLFTLMLENTAILTHERKEPLVVVMESFRLFGHLAGKQIGSQMEASQVIGAVKYAVALSKGRMKLVMQEPSVNKAAALGSGLGAELVKKGQHLPDDISAYNHAHFWLTNNGYLRHRVLDA